MLTIKKTINMMALFFLMLIILSCDSDDHVSASYQQDWNSSETIIIDHNNTTITSITEQDILLAKEQLHIAYGHTSHGSQIITGMQGLVNFKGDQYTFNDGGTNGALDLRDRPFPGASDLGNPNRTEWAISTRNYLGSHPEVNIIIWSWCGQVSSATEEDIDTYLDLMNNLERDFPNVHFVYMTGHLDGTGKDGNLNQRNEQIRSFCEVNNKILYDFADIESYCPDGNTNYMELFANDNCDYDSDGNGSRDANWAVAWQNDHPEDIEWYNCSSAHSQSLNANRKAYAAWKLWVSLVK